MFLFQKSRKSLAWGHKIWRGEYQGIECIETCYLPGWKLVPKSDEEALRNVNTPERPRTVIPDKLPFPPLFEYLLIQEQEREGKLVTERPMMKTVLNPSRANRAILQSEADMLSGKTDLTSELFANKG